MKNLNEAILKRISIRTYINKPIAKVKRNQIKRLLQTPSKGPFGNKPRFQLIDVTEIPRPDEDSFDEANLFVVGSVKANSRFLEDYGYCMEKIILSATRMGFGTCWISGFPKRKKLVGKIELRKDEVIPGYSSIGHFQKKQSLALNIMELMSNTRQRKPWKELFFLGDFNTPLKKNQASDYEIPLEAVRVAPSSQNAQPWRVLKEKAINIFHFFFDPAESEELLNQERIDMGVAMCHFEISAEELNLPGHWEEIPQPGKEGPLVYVASWRGDS